MADSSECEQIAIRTRNFNNDADTGRFELQTFMQVSQTPSSMSARLSAEVVDTIEFLQLRSTWLPMLPAQIGSNETLDAAAQAITYAARYNVRLLNGTDDDGLRRRALVSNVIAVEHLRETIQSPHSLSDEVLATIFLLGWFEVLVPDRIQWTGSLFQHHKALRAVLISRPRSWAPSPLARAIFHTIVPMQFNYASEDPSAAIHSLFDDERWLEVVPTIGETLPESLIKLRRNALALFVKLPRFMKRVKRLRNGNCELLESCQSLASAMLQIDEKDAENELLHQVSIKPTIDSEDASATRYSYVFPSEVFLIGAINYWQTRIMVLQLSLSVDHSAKMLKGNRWLSIQAASDYLSEQDRMAKNVVMSWQYIKEDYLPGRLQMIPALKAVWASTEHRQSTSQGQPTLAIRKWIELKRQQVHSVVVDRNSG